MLVTNHVLSGAAIGAALSRPLPAFAVGVASHFALDATPHWGRFGSDAEFLRVAFVDGLTGLAAAAVLTRLAVRADLPRPALAAVVAGMAGAALPDLDKPAHFFLHHQLWPKPVNRFHRRIQSEEPGRFVSHELVAGLAFLVAALAFLRRLAR